MCPKGKGVSLAPGHKLPQKSTHLNITSAQRSRYVDLQGQQAHQKKQEQRGGGEQDEGEEIYFGVLHLGLKKVNVREGRK